MDINQQSTQYLTHLANRKRNPATLTTLSAYRTYINKWIRPNIGQTELASFDNGSMKTFVEILVNKELSPATIAGITNVVKGIIKSALDDNGNCLYPRTWNADFIDAPLIDVKEQKAPIITKETLQEALQRTNGQELALYSLLAGSGLRIAEAYALKVGPDDGKKSFWIPEESLLIVRGQLRQGKFYTTKTSAGVREVDLYPELNDLLRGLDRQAGKLLFANRDGRPIRPMTAYDDLKKAGIPGFHSLRRFRITYLRSQQVTDDLVKFW